jgi:hypothetical protein
MTPLSIPEVGKKKGILKMPAGLEYKASATEVYCLAARCGVHIMKG